MQRLEAVIDISALLGVLCMKCMVIVYTGLWKRIDKEQARWYVDILVPYILSCVWQKIRLIEISAFLTTSTRGVVELCITL